MSCDRCDREHQPDRALRSLCGMPPEIPCTCEDGPSDDEWIAKAYGADARPGDKPYRLQTTSELMLESIRNGD